MNAKPSIKLPWIFIRSLNKTVWVISSLVLLTVAAESSLGEPSPSTPTKVTLESPAPELPVTPSATSLSGHLNKIGAKMYGAYWCPYCTKQKQMFGEAFKQINYIECDPRAETSQTDLCIEAKIKGFPTWEINGRFYPGMLSLEQLAKFSGYSAEDATESMPVVEEEQKEK
ncbi:MULTISPECIES: hypothetical protein [Moorena]|uniref:Thioredoxin domain-containing protein n=1 Tax=Moorena producens 3L TaxID=489825 RepID=F4XR32_9CYAN|nr:MULTISPECIES: hypothetical protein [Moorena]EGJ33007.1 hypothetical protein LYNGBM3L_55780 [Moorena producens 3L]NEP36189.1 hypothetical protein [Moorena sp. SIO3B2]NEP68402.1 hypothetical protein [Moorena sp. SIO3A5]NEQ09569.1 hypothetical protein [Moorena sp. SIO4E2]NES42729.1 hypothetical protein [Moorena sp. SIO2C4]